MGTLEVKLVQAKNLANKDLIGKSDPFAVLFVRPLRDRTQTSKTIVRPHLRQFILRRRVVSCYNIMMNVDYFR